jgi:hypothetical protein
MNSTRHSFGITTFLATVYMLLSSLPTSANPNIALNPAT